MFNFSCFAPFFTVLRITTVPLSLTFVILKGPSNALSSVGLIPPLAWFAFTFKTSSPISYLWGTRRQFSRALLVEAVRCLRSWMYLQLAMCLMLSAMSRPNTNCPGVAWLVACHDDRMAYPMADMIPANGSYGGGSKYISSNAWNCRQYTYMYFQAEESVVE